MFYDWLTCSQEFDAQLPLVSETLYSQHELGEDGEITDSQYFKQAPIRKAGSFCTSVKIRCNGSRLTVDGNPSRYGRIDNVFGISNLDTCFDVFNQITSTLGLPAFTKTKNMHQLQTKDGSLQLVGDGAFISRLDITTNKSVGQGNEGTYIKALSTVAYRNSIPKLYENGKTAGWLSKTGKSNLIYPSVYDKAFELQLHSLSKIKRKYGDDSNEYHYLKKVIDFCSDNGVVRFEQKLRHRQLQRMGCQWWGTFQENCLRELQEQFLNIDQRLQVDNMTFQGIAQKLLTAGVVETTLAANTTANYAFQWMHGETFDTSKRAVQTHRKRLRQIGIDIARPCDVTTFSPVTVTNSKRIEVSALHAPTWYKQPQIQRLAAVA